MSERIKSWQELEMEPYALEKTFEAMTEADANGSSLIRINRDGIAIERNNKSTPDSKRKP